VRQVGLEAVGVVELVVGVDGLRVEMLGHRVLPEQLREPLVAHDQRALALVGDEVRLAVDAGLETERGRGEQRAGERLGAALGERRVLAHDGQREARDPVGVKVLGDGPLDLGHQAGDVAGDVRLLLLAQCDCLLRRSAHAAVPPGKLVSRPWACLT
jgi:hypothetical protein